MSGDCLLELLSRNSSFVSLLQGLVDFFVKLAEFGRIFLADGLDFLFSVLVKEGYTLLILVLEHRVLLLQLFDHESLVIEC